MSQWERWRTRDVRVLEVCGAPGFLLGEGRLVGAVFGSGDRIAHPGAGVVVLYGVCSGSGVVTRRRPTFPRLEAQYHGRWGVSRPSSGWDRVCHPRDDHRATVPDPERVTSGIGCVVESVCGAAWCCVRCPAFRPGDAAVGSERYRVIRTARLRRSPGVHLRPIDVMVSHDPRGRLRLEVGFPLRCLQRLSRQHLATQRCRWRDNWCTRGASVPVLSYWGRLLSSLLHPRQIGTELSHDVLNPAHVPL